MTWLSEKNITAEARDVLKFTDHAFQIKLQYAVLTWFIYHCRWWYLWTSAHYWPNTTHNLQLQLKMASLLTTEEMDNSKKSCEVEMYDYLQKLEEIITWNSCSLTLSSDDITCNTIYSFKINYIWINFYC